MSAEPETREQFDLRIEAARRQHDLQHEWTKIHAGQITTFATAGMRTPGLAAAGGVAAALGFYSANYTRLAADPANLDLFNDILFWLFMSLLPTLIAPGMAYLSQLSYMTSITKEELYWEPPFVRQTRASKYYTWAGNVCRWLTVVCVLISISMLVIGGIQFLKLVHA